MPKSLPVLASYEVDYGEHYVSDWITLRAFSARQDCGAILGRWPRLFHFAPSALSFLSNRRLSIHGSVLRTGLSTILISLDDLERNLGIGKDLPKLDAAILHFGFPRRWQTPAFGLLTLK